MTKRWKLQDATLASGPLAAMPLVERVLAARGMTDPEAVKLFCEPKLSHLHDPALLPGVDAAAKRLIEAIRRDEQIVIYGDYDVDGITATAILYHTIKTVQPKARLHTYVPHRLEEGYGLNCDALRQLKTEGAQLIITVDCGITATTSARTARELGLDLIITDHHELRNVETSKSPNVKTTDPATEHVDVSTFRRFDVCVVHPRLPGSQYPFGDLCGAGVAFKLAWHFAKLWCNSDRVSEALQKTLVNMLPLVALGTIADVVPLVGENRILTMFGLRVIKQTPLPGLRALIEASKLMDEKIDCERVGFVLAPRLNACGRMGHAAEAVRLFTEASAEEGAAIASRLTAHNLERQKVERRIFDEAVKLAEDTGMTCDACRAIVLAHESWHPGVVGIVCSRLVERFGRPAILMNRSAELCKGSGRSIDDYSLHEGLSVASAHLLTYGGHAMAAGLSLHPQHLEAFAQALTAHANQHISVDQLVPSLAIDCEANMMDLDAGAVDGLQRLSPFGRGNRQPTILLRDAVLAEPPKQMGANGKHLALKVRQDINGTRKWLRLVWWSAGDRAADLAAGMPLDVAIQPKLNVWNGQTSVEAEVRDLRIRAAQASPAVINEAV